MNHFVLGLLTLFVAQQVSCYEHHWESPYFRRFEDSREECSEYLALSVVDRERILRNQYPDEPKVHQLIHCVLTDLQAVLDPSGLNRAQMAAFFQPLSTDTCFESRTEKCLETSLANVGEKDFLARAYKIFICYYRNYGTLVQEHRFVNYCNDSSSLYVKESLVFQNVALDVLQQFCQGNILNVREFQEVIYTFLLRTGFYDLNEGLAFDRLHIQYHRKELLEAEIQQCQTDVKRQFCQEPVRAYQIFKQCLNEYVNVLEIVQKVSKALVEAAGASCGCSVPETTTPAPCYTCGAPTPCIVCPRLLTISTPRDSCNSCGAPAPCNVCYQNSTILSDATERPKTQPCYNGQC
ncbi:uncharacterized protein LOC129741455 [Uranotaenia lowii]|uniref:uncharacterized protein LOC129741455 n=1 Tax=Uranotaenia lowii TaxID=190385 RepID=UPI002478E708|nr:uncharacterized protein LOC129741455 [Uranotaenia lowii]